MAGFDLSTAKPVAGFDLSTATPVQAPQQPSFLQNALQALSKYANYAASPMQQLNMGAHLASGAVAGLGGGLTYLGTLGATGGDTDAAKAVQEATQQALTYQPRTKAGKDLTEAADDAMAIPGKLLNKAGEATTDATGSPLLGAAVNTGGNALLQLLGAKGALKGVSAGDVADALTYKPREAPAPTAPASAATSAIPTTPAELAQSSLNSGKQVGYVTTPNWDPSSSLLERLGQSIAGKASEQRAGITNQGVTNALAARSIGLSPSALITNDVLRTIRNTAADQGYKPIEDLQEPVMADPQYLKNMADIQKRSSNPLSGTPDVAATADLLNQTSFDPAEITDNISTLRNRADDAFTQGRSSAGTEFKAQANELEALLDRHLQNADDVPPNLLNNYRSARQLIAKTYSIGDNLNKSTGNVDAIGIGKLLDNDVPLVGDLKTIADFANTAPGISRVPQGVALPSSPTTNLVATAAGGAHGAAVGAVIPAVRLAIAKYLLKRNQNPSMLQPASNTFAQSALDAIHGSAAGFRKFYGGPAAASSPGALLSTEQDNSDDNNQ